MMSLANDPFPGPSSTSCSCPGLPAPIHSLMIHTPISWTQKHATSQTRELHLVLQSSRMSWTHQHHSTLSKLNNDRSGLNPNALYLSENLTDLRRSDEIPVGPKHVVPDVITLKHDNRRAVRPRPVTGTSKALSPSSGADGK